MGCPLTIYASGSSQKKPCSLGKVAWVSATKAVLLCISMRHWENTRQTDAPRCKGWHCGSRIGAKEAELVEVRESSGRLTRHHQHSLSAVLQLPSTLIARLDWRVICTGEGSLRLSLHTKVSDSQSHVFFLLGKPHGKEESKNEDDFWRCRKRGVKDYKSQDKFNSVYLWGFLFFVFIFRSFKQ